MGVRGKYLLRYGGSVLLSMMIKEGNFYTYTEQRKP